MNSTSEFEESDSRLGLTGLVLDGRYRVESALGRGGFATVYLATDERSFGRSVVVKVPHAEVLAQKGFRKRFDQEILSLTRLEHPHIVKVLDVGTVNGIPYVVLQYLAGGSLADRIHLNGGRLLLPDVLSWLREIAGALDFIHRNGFIHRDVKPSNILFDAEGHPFLADFGIVKAVETSEMALTLTETGKMLGSVRYMAPEAVHPHKISPASYDQYSLGVVVYYALSATFPHAGETPLQLLYKRVAEPPEPLGSLVPDLQPEVAAAVMRALRAEPLERFTSCMEFALTLERESLERKREEVQATAAVPAQQTQPDETALAQSDEAGAEAQSIAAAEAEGAEEAVSRSIEMRPDEPSRELDLEVTLPRWLVRSLWVIGLSVPVLGAGLLGLHFSGPIEESGQQQEKDDAGLQVTPKVSISLSGDGQLVFEEGGGPRPATAITSPVPSPAAPSVQETPTAPEATETPGLAPLADASPTETSTEQPSSTVSATPTEAPSPITTATEPASATQTEAPPTATATETVSATPTQVPEATPTVTETASATPTELPTATLTETASATPTEVPPTATVTETTVPSETPVSTATETPTAEQTHTPTASATQTPSASATQKRPTRSPTRTAKPRPSPTTTTTPEPLVEGKPLRQWISEAGSPDLAVLRRAIQTLGRLGPRAGAAVPVIVKAIRHPDPEVRLDAVIALVQIDAEAKRSVPELTRALGDPAPGVRSAAAFALTKLTPGDPSVIPALTEALGDSRVQVRQLAAMHLGSFGKAASAAAPRLVERLTDPQEPVRLAAVKALIDMGLLVEVRIVKRVEPKIPAAARKARVRGSVVLRAVVRVDGSVGKVTVVQGLNSECNEAAEKALVKWKFEPSTYKGRPVESFITVSMPFDATQPTDD